MARSRILTRLAALVVLVLLVTTAATGARAEAPSTRLRVSPTVSELEVGEVATLEVRVEDVTDLYGYQVYLHYDPALLLAVDAAGKPASQVELGSFFAADLVVRNAVDPVAGRVEVIAAKMGSAPPNGSGVLFTLRFKGLSRNVAAVTIDTGETILAGTDGMPIPYTTRDAALYVGVEAPPPAGQLCLPMVVRAAP